MEQFFNLLGPGIFAFIGGAFGGYLTSEWNFRNQLKTTTWEKRQQAYPEIMGLRFLRVEQLYQSYQAKFFRGFNTWKWHKSEDKDPLEQSRAEHCRQKHEDLLLEVARTNERLFKSIGLAKGSFLHSTELDSLIAPIYQFSNPDIPLPLPQTADVKNMNTWTDTAKQNLQNFIFEKHVKPINALLNYLKAHMDEDIK